MTAHNRKKVLIASVATTSAAVAQRNRVQSAYSRRENARWLNARRDRARREEARREFARRENARREEAKKEEERRKIARREEARRRILRNFTDVPVEKFVLRQRSARRCFLQEFGNLCADEAKFLKKFGMPLEQFNALFGMVEHMLESKRYPTTDAIIPKEKMAFVLEFLASGDLQKHIARNYCVSNQYVLEIIDIVCSAICDVLTYTIPPLSKERFTEIAKEFKDKWNFPNCIGAIYSKHVTTKPSKGINSTFIIAVCDASYRFRYLDVGAYGNQDDRKVLKNSKFGEALSYDRQDFPPDSELNGIKLPYFYICDDAFPLSKRFMIPYKSCSGCNLPNEETHFNERFNFARLTIQNAFGIMATKWNCLKESLPCSPERAKRIITTCCMLHNYLLETNKNKYCPPRYSDSVDADGNLVEGCWRDKIECDSIFHCDSLAPTFANNIDYGRFVRNAIRDYVNTD